MATISRSTTWVTGDTLTSAAQNSEFNVIQNDYNGNITNVNVSATADIAYSKLNLSGNIVNADISASAAITASKISGTAVTLTATETITGVKTFNAGVIGVLTVDTDGSTITFNMNTSNYHAVTLGGNRVLAVSNVGTGQRFIVRLLQDGTGSRTVTWFDTIKWAGGSAPTLTTTADKADVFGFMCTGTNAYDGFVIGQNI